MKNKGFTLVELLAVVTVMGLVFAIIMPKLMGVIVKTEKDTFANNAQLLITSARNYMNSADRTLSLPATNGQGTVVTITFLKTKGYIKKTDNLANSVVVVYNNNGSFEYYVFATDGKYYISGYKSADIESNTQDVVTAVNYVTATNGITTFTLTGNHLTY